MGCGEAGDWNAVGRTGDVIEADRVAELHGARFTAMFTANSDLEVRSNAPTGRYGKSNQLANAIPVEDLERFGVPEEQIARELADERWRTLMAFECSRARAMLCAGAPLAGRLPGRMGLEIRATVHGGATILDKIDAASGDVFRHRPTLGATDWTKIILKSLLRRAAP